GLSTLRLDAGPGLRPLFPVWESEAEFRDEGSNVGVLLEHERPFNWIQEVLVTDAAVAGQSVKLTAKIRTQVCQRGCEWFDVSLPLTVPVSNEPAVPVAPWVTKQLDVKESLTVVPVPDRFKKAGSEPKKGDLSKSGSNSGDS